MSSLDAAGGPSEEALREMLRDLRSEPPQRGFTATLQQKLWAEVALGALRVEPPNNDFEQGLRQRLETESRLKAVRSLRGPWHRRRGLWALAAAALFAAGAAASVESDWVGQLAKRVIPVIGTSADSVEAPPMPTRKALPRPIVPAERAPSPPPNPLVEEVRVEQEVGDAVPRLEPQRVFSDSPQAADVSVQPRDRLRQREVSRDEPQQPTSEHDQGPDPQTLRSQGSVAPLGIDSARPRVPRVQIGLEGDRRAPRGEPIYRGSRDRNERAREVARERREERARQRVGREGAQRAPADTSSERFRPDQRRERKPRERLREGRAPR